ncbi:MAG: DUF362 domain-containing protein [Deltaproteobacteria bacterium]|nr:DUF362 domain-containing protein [Deltaproteobacteria bacterium]
METDEVKKRVSIVRYERPLDSVKKAVDLCRGLDHLPRSARVFIKPNIVFWTKSVPFPKWGVITTSRVVEDVVILLKEHGIENITIGEGMVTFDPKDTETPHHAFESLGYPVLKKRYGVEYVNVHERPFEKQDLGDGISLHFNTDFLHSDFLVDLPVLKTHAQTVVSLGIKNIKGTIDINSRKKCHSPDPVKDLNFMISRYLKVIPPCLTILDGIYTTERGPGFDGKVRRSNVLVASPDMLSADLVGARILGYDTGDVPYLVHAARLQGRPLDLSDVEIAGERIADVASRHQYEFPYTEDGSLPLPMKRMGIEGLSYWKYDLTMCTYCSLVNGPVLVGIAQAWGGKAWDDVEVLTGKIMKPTPGKKKTILLGKCMYQANKDNPDIQEMIAVKGCPPSPKKIVEAFQKAGISLSSTLLEQIDMLPGFFMRKYEGKPEFDESFFKIQKGDVVD